MNRSKFTRLVSVLAILLGTVGIVRGQGSTTFNYTGSVQTYTVPAGVTYLGVDMKGGCGGVCLHQLWNEPGNPGG